MNGPEFLIPIAFFGMIAYVVRSVLAYRERRLDRLERHASLPSDIAVRLDRMEQAIDSLAVEMERMGESQRFTQQLMQGQQAGAAARGLRSPSHQ